MSEEETLLTSLCTICHIQPPKYRCPRCSTRTCSLPCTRRHKVWSQCSGVRDPAAYLRRNELTTESAFDRDFNFITGIERRIERAGREAENRGVGVDGRSGVHDLGVVGLEGEEELEHGLGDARGKRKRGPGPGPGPGPGTGPNRGLAKGEAGFLKRAEEAGVKVIKAPKGMSRARMNGSKWHGKQKCLQWTVEFITDDGSKRVNCTETITIAEAYDRAFPLPKEERQRYQEAEQEAAQEPALDEKKADPSRNEPSASDTVPKQTTTEPADNEPTTSQQDTTPQRAETQPTSHRDVYFYLHRPRTATKQPVLIPLVPNTTLTAALHDRVVLEFPTVYILKAPLNDEHEQTEEGSKFILEKEYLRTHQNTNTELDEEAAADTDAQPVFGTGAVDIPDVDEGKMLEVLQKDLLGRGTAPAAEAS